jgi:Zn-dependent M28 family amino/carboxypeptidase
LAKTVADINLDALNIFGRMRDIVQSGLGWSALDDYLRAAAAEQDRVVVGDPHPETGGFFRSDHFPFVKMGVPAVNAGSGDQHREKGAEWGRKTKAAYAAQHYHKPSDEYRDSWDMSGALEDLRLVFAVGWRLSMEAGFPAWTAASPYQRPAPPQK